LSAAAAVAGCHWREPGGPDAAEAICAFLAGIGIVVDVAPPDGPRFVPGMAIAGGRLVVDPDGGGYPGDLLHEAGHIAVAEPESRAAMSEVGTDPGEEMAAIAWSVAAARACGVPLEVLFHPEGYKGDAASLIENFAAGRTFG
jgi:hypothetical protein